MFDSSVFHNSSLHMTVPDPPLLNKEGDFHNTHHPHSFFSKDPMTAQHQGDQYPPPSHLAFPTFIAVARCANCLASGSPLLSAVVMPFKIFVCSNCKSAHQAFLGPSDGWGPDGYCLGAPHPTKSEAFVQYLKNIMATSIVGTSWNLQDGKIKYLNKTVIPLTLPI